MVRGFLFLAGLFALFFFGFFASIYCDGSPWLGLVDWAVGVQGLPPGMPPLTIIGGGFAAGDFWVERFFVRQRAWATRLADARGSKVIGVLLFFIAN
jgi:hypothetical protein